jgi:hypothetical protein
VILLAPRFVMGAETVDRVVAVIGNNGITESDVIQEYRFEAFAAGRSLPASLPDAAAFGKAESRLIDQKLLEQQLANYPEDRNVVREKADEQMDRVRKHFKDFAQFDAALRSLGLTRAQFLSRLEQQQHILMMIDNRLRPAAAVEPRDIQTYYHKTFLPEFHRRYGGDPPPLSQVQDRIREILVQEKINRLLQQWLGELKQDEHVQILTD